MKTFVKIFLLIVVLFVLASAAFAAPVTAVKKDTMDVSVTPTHYKDLLILKAGKTFRGATVEVHDAAGAVVASSHISRKKMIIDFYDIPYGAYTICIVKNKKMMLEFNHIKSQGSEILN